MTQLNLFKAPPDSQPVAILEQLLLDHARWITATQLHELVPAWNERQIRALAEASGNIISGQRGYKHIKHATPEEMHHACSWLESQAVKMLTRAQRIRRVAHATVAGVEPRKWGGDHPAEASDQAPSVPSAPSAVE